MSATEANQQPVQLWDGEKLIYVSQSEANKLLKAGHHTTHWAIPPKNGYQTKSEAVKPKRKRYKTTELRAE